MSGRQEWTAMTDVDSPGSWRPCGVSGSLDEARSEAADWIKDVGEEHVRLASRNVSDWQMYLGMPGGMQW